MILELILIVAILGIFIIIVRRLPEAIKEGRATVVPSLPVSPVTMQPSGPTKTWWSRFWPVTSGAASTPVSAPSVSQATVDTAPSQPQITDETLVAEGDTYMEQGKVKEAERSYLRAVAKSPKNPKLYNRLGAIYLKTRNYSDALQAFEAACDLDDTKASRHYNVALAAWQLGKLGTARDAIARAITLDPNAQKYQELKSQIENGNS